jgi:hypothetical protein
MPAQFWPSLSMWFIPAVLTQIQLAWATQQLDRGPAYIRIHRVLAVRVALPSAHDAVGDKNRVPER